MADQTTGSLPAVQEVAIGDLPAIADLYDDTLIPVEQQGEARHMTGAQWKKYAQAGVSKYVTDAQQASEKALEAASRALTAVDGIGTAVEDTKANAEAAENAKAGAEDARAAIENMLVEAISLETGRPATVSKELVDGVVKLVFGLPAGGKGDQGDPGSSIQSITRTAGTGASGTTDTYTVTLTDGSTTEFYVYNGKDGTGAGDMSASVYDPQGKKTDVFQYVDDALGNKQDALTGTQGQVAGFDAEGKLVAQDVPGTAVAAAKLSTARTIDGVSFDGSANIKHYGVCSTAASTAAKVVDLDGFTLAVGSKIAVKFVYANTSVSPTLNVNDTGAIAIKQYGTTALSTYMWHPASVVEFVYDGAYWIMVDSTTATTTYYGLTKLSSSTSSTSTTLAATPSAVKAAYDLANGKQDALTGVKGQVVGFDEAGNPIAQDAPEGGVTSFNGRTGTITPQSGDYTADDILFSDGKTFQEKYESGELTGEKGDPGLFYATCATAAATAAKVATCSGFTLTTGAVVAVKFTYANTAASPTLNVNSTGAKSIAAYGTTALPVDAWVAGATVVFVYDGTQWIMNTALASRLATARTILTNLASTAAASFDGSANVTPGITGKLPIANGGTGVSTLAALKILLGISDGAKIEVGTYVGACASSDATVQEVPVAFAPKFVWVGMLDTNANVKYLVPWTFWHNDDYNTDVSEYYSYVYSAYAYYGTPATGSDDDGDINVLEITETGFNVCNASYSYKSTSGAITRTYLSYLNYNSHPYFYLAIG